MGHYRLNLIGPFGLFLPNGERIAVKSQKAMALLAILAVSPGGERARRKLESLLWGAQPDENARASLRRELSNLRGVFKKQEASDLLLSDTKRVGLSIEKLDVDINSLGLSTFDRRARFAGDFLEGIDLRDCEEFEDWLRDERGRIRDMISAAMSDTPEIEANPKEIWGGSSPSAQETLGDKYLKRPPKPSIAILPFEILYGNEEPWLGAGLADEISVCISQYPQLFVVSSIAARKLVTDNIDNDEIAARLGVRFLLEGSIIRENTSLRVSVALIDSEVGEQCWAESFIGKSDNTFSLQQEISSQIAPQIWTKVDGAERQKILRLIGPVSGDYEKYWRANALFRTWNENSIREAMDLVVQLVKAEPTCPWATSLAAYCHSISFLMGYSKDKEVCQQKAITYYQMALRYGEDNVEALGYCIGTLLNLGDAEMAEHIAAKSLNLLPAHQPTLFWAAWVDVFRHNGARAVERFELALRINPVAGVRGQTLAGLGFASLQLGKNDRALSFFTSAKQDDADFPPTILGLWVTAQLLNKTEISTPIAKRMSDQSYLPFISLFSAEHQKIVVAAIDTATSNR